MESPELTPSEILEGLARRIETELHGDQTGFKALAGFVPLDQALSIADGFVRPAGIGDLQVSKDLAIYLNEYELVGGIAQDLIVQACENPSDPSHELAKRIEDRFESVQQENPNLLPELFSYIVGGFDVGLAIIAAIDDRFWDDDQLGPAGEVGPTLRTESASSDQAACDMVARHAYERNSQYSGVVAISGFLPHSPLLRMFPELAPQERIEGAQLSQFLANQLQESGAIASVVDGLLRNVAVDPNHPNADIAARILSQIEEDLAKDQEHYRKPLHYIAGNDDGIAIAVVIDDRFWSSEW